MLPMLLGLLLANDNGGSANDGSALARSRPRTSSVPARSATLTPLRAHHDEGCGAACTEGLACLRGATVFMQGYCDMREMVGWLHGVAGCDGVAPRKEDACQLLRVRVRVRVTG